MGAGEQIRVSAAVKRTLDEQKRPGESYNEVLERVLAAQVERRREVIRQGAGVWEGTDAAAAARAASEELAREIGPEE